jgi:hypothetical protein
MGFFDKLKASVGIGNTTVVLEAPYAVTSEQAFVAKVTLKGGAHQQKLTRLDAQFVINHKTSAFEENVPPDTRVDLAVPKLSGDLAPGSTTTYELPLKALPMQDLFADAQDYAQVLLGEDEERLWQADGPLPFISMALGKRCELYVGADIPGAPDPGASVPLLHLPQAMGPLVLQAGLTTAGFDTRLRELGATRVWVSNATNRWFVFWQNAEGLTVAHSPLEVVCSVRPDGLHRAYGNPNIPKESAMQRLSHEAEAQREGGLEDGRAWAEELVARTPGAVLLSRPIGNAWAALTQVSLPR